MSALDTRVKIGVIGAGAMGSGIAQVAACAGHPVYLFDTSAAAVARGLAAIDKNLRFLVDRGKLTDSECAATLARLKPVTEVHALADAGLLIEAIVEDLGAKQRLFGELESLVASDAILASNTSSLSITAIGATLERPQRLAGLHFFNPAPRMALVEIVSGLATASEVAATLYATAAAWGKAPVHARSTPGFIVNRIARPFYAEALQVLAEGAASPASLDAVMRDGAGFAMGPFELMDLIGQDVNYAVTASVHAANYADNRFVPSLIQHELVLAGHLGRKSGQGFFAYADGAARPTAEYAGLGVRPTRVVADGDLGVAAALVERLQAASIQVSRQAASATPGLLVDGVRLVLTDGRTATLRGSQEHCSDLVLFDLVGDFATSTTIAAARSDRTGDAAWAAALGVLQGAGFDVIVMDDVAGLLAMRSVAMLANEAADAVNLGVASAVDVDTAMRRGTNYPQGPLAWADAIGLPLVAAVLDNLYAHYRESRYRVSPLLRRRSISGQPLAAPPGEE